MTAQKLGPSGRVNSVSEEAMDPGHHQKAAQRFCGLNRTDGLEQALEKAVGALSPAEISHLVTGTSDSSTSRTIRNKISRENGFSINLTHLSTSPLRLAKVPV